MMAGACHMPTRLSDLAGNVRLDSNKPKDVGFIRARLALDSVTKIMSHFPSFETKRNFSEQRRLGVDRFALTERGSVSRSTDE